MRLLGDPRRPASFAVLVLLAFVAARFLGVGIHEVLGHGATALAFGGSFYGAYVSPVTGFALVLLPEGAPPGAALVVLLSGIVAELLVGLLVLALYPRLRTFVSRLFALVFLMVLLVYSLAYLGTGALSGVGDPAQVARILRAPHLPVALLVVALPWSVAAAYVVSAEVLRLVGLDAAPGEGVRHLVLFWLLPIPIGALPNVVQLVSAAYAVLAYVALFLLVVAALAFGWFAGPRPSRALAPLGIAEGRAAPVLVAFVLVVPAWVGVFGLTGDTAHGVLFSEPPLEAERLWASPQAVNLRVHVAADGAVTLSFRFKGVRTAESPIEREVVSSFEDRAHLPYWEAVAGELAAGAMNGTAWDATSSSIEAMGTIWFVGGERGNPRLVTLGLAAGEDASPFLRRSTDGPREVWTLTVFDPLRHDPPVPCPGCYIDEVNLTWDAGAPEPFALLADGVDSGSPERLLGFDASAGAHFLRLRNASAAAAPEVYTIALATTP